MNEMTALNPTLVVPDMPPYVCSIVDGLLALSPDKDTCQRAAALIMKMSSALDPDFLTVCLSKNTATRGGVVLGLTPNQAVLVHQMVNSYPEYASAQNMARALWGAKEHSINTTRVMMTDLRKRLAPLKVKIQNQSGVGYRLDLQPIT